MHTGPSRQSPLESAADMPRARNIKPGFFTNDLLAETGPLGMLLFEGLWCMADREGRLEDRPRRLKAELLPYFDADVDALLDELASRGFVVRYERDGARYLQVVNFGKHQSPHVKEAPSTIPAPDEHGASTGKESLIADSLIADSGLRIADTSARPRAKAEPDVQFEAFWQRYPRKEPSKKEAARAWAKVKAPFDEVMAGLERWRVAWDSRGDPTFVPHATTWLNQERWTAPAPTSAARASPNGRNNDPEAMFALARKYEEQGR